MRNLLMYIAFTVLLVLLLLTGCSLPEKTENSVIEPEPAENIISSPEQNESVNPYATVSIGEVIQFGNIDWLVLEIENDKALIISNNVLMTRMYCNTNPTNWEKSNIRQFLNDSFYNETFSDDEKELIIDTNLINPANSYYNTDGGNNTADRVFLLSIDEVLKYFGNSGNVKETVFGDVLVMFSIDDEYNDMRIAYDDDDNASNWWLRSPGNSGEVAVIVSNDGVIFLTGSPAISGNGVRPAMWINIK